MTLEVERIEAKSTINREQKRFDVDNSVYVRIDEAKYISTKTINSALTYQGRRQLRSDNTYSETDTVWQVKRILTQGTEVTTDFVDEGKYNQAFNDPDSLFPTPVLINSYSTNFDGINDHLNGGDIHLYDITDAFSISMWVKPQNVAATRILFSKASPAAAVDGYMLRHNTGGALFLQMRSGTNRSHTFASTLTASVWQHLVFTYAGGSNISGASIYLDSVIDSNLPASGGLSGTMLVGADFIIGNRTSTFHYSGNMDEISVWDKELTQTDVNAIYNSGAPTDLSSHASILNLQSWYRMGDGDTFDVVRDVIGTDDLTMVTMDSGDFELDVP